MTEDNFDKDIRYWRRELFETMSSAFNVSQYIVNPLKQKVINLKSNNMQEVKIINKSTNDLPAYATKDSAGMDLRANLESPITVKVGERVIVPTGLFIQLPEGHEAQIRPRSGLAAKHGITVLNTPGTIDADYRGEIKVILINLGQEDFVISHGERICQMVVAKYERVSFELVERLDDTVRGEGGFGHSGKE